MKKYSVGIISILFLVGCQLPADKRYGTAREMTVALQSASDEDYAIARNALPKFPIEVKTALVPDLSVARGASVLKLEKRFDIYAEQTPAKTFFLGLVEGTPYNITVHPAVEGKISLQLKKVTIPEALETVRSVYGYDFRKTRRGVEILPATIQTRAFVVNYLNVNRMGTSNSQVTAGTLNVNGNNSATSGVPGVPASTNTYNSTNTLNGQNGQVTTTPNSSIATDYNTDFWTDLKKSVEAIIGSAENRKVAISPIASLLVVTAMPEELKQVEEFLIKADLSVNRQVILEAKILEVELNDSFQAGINWTLLSGRVQSTQFGGEVIKNPLNPSDAFPVLSDVLSPPVNINPGATAANAAANVGTFGGVFAIAMNGRNVGTFLEFLGAQGKVHVLSNPRVSTINNQKALIKVGFDRFFITSISTTSTISSSTTQQTPNVTFNPFFTGVALDVTPHITDRDNVTLHIHPIVSSVEDDIKDFTLNGLPQSYPLAKSTVRESDSMVKAKSGEMIIIGGLMQDATAELTEGIPVLKNLPLLGNLFKHTYQRTKKSELVILLKPTVVHNQTWAEESDDTIDRFERFNEEMRRDESRYRCKGPNC